MESLCSLALWRKDRGTVFIFLLRPGCISRFDTQDLQFERSLITPITLFRYEGNEIAHGFLLSPLLRYLTTQAGKTPAFEHLVLHEAAN